MELWRNTGTATVQATVHCQWLPIRSVCVCNSPAADLMFVLCRRLGPTDKLRVCVWCRRECAESWTWWRCRKCVFWHELTEAFNIHTRGTLRSVYRLGEGRGHVRFRPSSRHFEMTVVLSLSVLQTFSYCPIPNQTLHPAPNVLELKPLGECST